MDAEIDELIIDVRASTSGFEADIATMKAGVDTNLVDGFGRAGAALEKGLVSAIRQGNLGFDDLKRAASQAFDQIASEALQLGLDQIFGGAGSSSPSGLGGLIGSVGALFGLPGRATGGPVSPGRGYVVGERGPELFIPTSAGRVEANAAGSGGARDVKVAIQLNAPRGASAPAAMQRSSRQVASAIRRTLAI
ncbi:tail tape measure protein [Altererythrobacter sp. RZ02]|uniref:Tail tape measure protein n=1 Tax=Pontixanthobacter rizhaonensis TaxID=2730337 RepID=A0A848QQH4_9SPHN|nr:tail tape measure protein [Pontixanthobacter rizhaonensis]NMW32827.1 tail tape measure protein [Pontixanthobacter rizhaonensis]